MDSALETDFDLVCSLSNKGHYDYIIVGSGIGGGILARTLALESPESKSRVLLIEKGDLTFHTHCLNGSRPHWQRGGTKGPSQDNDVIYQDVKKRVSTTPDSDPYAGGPVYCLGGRSTVWGLFAPKIDDNTLMKYFPSCITKELKEKYYDIAIELLTNGSQMSINNPDPHPRMSNSDDNARIASMLQDAKEKLDGAIGEWSEKVNDTKKKYENASTAPIAAQFASEVLYNFPQGAYSTVDGLLELLYAKNQSLTLLTNTEVLSLDLDNTEASSFVRPKAGQPTTVKAKTVVLCAGTIGTATIALNSGLQRLNWLVGKGLTDHEIWGVRIAKDRDRDVSLLHAQFPFSMPPNLPKPCQQPLKLQKMIKIQGQPALLNVCQNADTFLSRKVLSENTQNFNSQGKKILFSNNEPAGCDTLNITLEFRAKLRNNNMVHITPTSQPVIRIKRKGIFGEKDESAQKDMQELATTIRNKFLFKDQAINGIQDAPRLKLADFGVVAHEVGTMRMPKPNGGANARDGSVVTCDLQFEGVENLYVCDLSVFPPATWKHDERTELIT
ncbi:FAD/NAD(P)-binding domain superfamily [Fusarium oxysporum f. sp. vasinfectum]|nr:FAD/NAD(P)-binding domain superfamily [Fusarium oxysporum f. sp. vasinfectum]